MIEILHREPSFQALVPVLVLATSVLRRSGDGVAVLGPGRPRAAQRRDNLARDGAIAALTNNRQSPITIALDNQNPADLSYEARFNTHTETRQ